MPGSHYNIIVVPPNKTSDEDETLEGAKVLCSIPAVDKRKPSYYHSFGESEVLGFCAFIQRQTKTHHVSLQHYYCTWLGQIILMYKKKFIERNKVYPAERLHLPTAAP